MEPCDTCFFGSIKDSSMAPCKSCSGYNKYVKDSVYFWEGKKEEWAEDTDKSIDAGAYDNVKKPKHYMLFEDKNIEVRDVLQKVTDKIYASGFSSNDSLFVSDYVQMMQYLMRFMDKNGVQDLEKAAWYLDKIIKGVKDVPNDS